MDSYGGASQGRGCYNCEYHIIRTFIPPTVSIQGPADRAHLFAHAPDSPQDNLPPISALLQGCSIYPSHLDLANDGLPNRKPKVLRQMNAKWADRLSINLRRHSNILLALGHFHYDTRN
jgi:hypothetical protein